MHEEDSVYPVNVCGYVSLCLRFSYGLSLICLFVRNRWGVAAAIPCAIFVPTKNERFSRDDLFTIALVVFHKKSLAVEQGP